MQKNQIWFFGGTFPNKRSPETVNFVAWELQDTSQNKSCWSGCWKTSLGSLSAMKALMGVKSYRAILQQFELTCSEAEEGLASSASHHATFSNPPLDLEYIFTRRWPLVTVKISSCQPKWHVILSWGFDPEGTELLYLYFHCNKIIIV